MNIYKISQNENNRYDTYDSAIVCAENPEKAKLIHPDTGDEYGEGWESEFNYCWVSTY